MSECVCYIIGSGPTLCGRDETFGTRRKEEQQKTTGVGYMSEQNVIYIHFTVTCAQNRWVDVREADIGQLAVGVLGRR